MPVLSRSWAPLIGAMEPGRWYSRVVLRAMAPAVARSWPYGPGRPYLHRARLPVPDIRRRPAPGYIALFKLNDKGEALRASFIAAQSGDARQAAS
jgi:hypothetical protein